jgi:dynein heavy chain
MQDVLFIAAMGPPGGGRSPITQRYQRHFNLLSIVEFDNKAGTTSFTTLLNLAS